MAIPRCGAGRRRAQPWSTVPLLRFTAPDVESVVLPAVVPVVPWPLVPVVAVVPWPVVSVLLALGARLVVVEEAGWGFDEELPQPAAVTAAMARIPARTERPFVLLGFCMAPRLPRRRHGYAPRSGTTAPVRRIAHRSSPARAVGDRHALRRGAAPDQP